MDLTLVVGETPKEMEKAFHRVLEEFSYVEELQLVIFFNRTA